MNENYRIFRPLTYQKILFIHINAEQDDLAIFREHFFCIFSHQNEIDKYFIYRMN